MRPARFAVCLSLALVSSAQPILANDEVFRALGLGLGVVNTLQQQQLQQQQQQRQQQQRLQQQQQRQTAPQRQAAPSKPRAVDTAAAQRQRAAVAEVQASLNRLGYDAGPVDGDPGPRTRNAIAAFRADYGLDGGAGIDDQLTGALRVAARNAPAVAAGAARVPGAPQAVSPPLWNAPEPGFDPAMAAAPDVARVAEDADGALWIDGRLAVVSGVASWAGAVPEGFDVAGDLARLVRDITFASADAWRSSDAAALTALGSLDLPIVVEIVEEAIGRPIDASRAYRFDGRRADSLLRDLSPFEEQRAIAGLRARADGLVRRDLPPQPLPLRVYCTLDLGEYDFATSAFPVTRMDECNSAVDGAPGPMDRSRPVWSAPLPDRLPYPPETAEAFNALVRDTNFFLASFDSDLAIDVITSESTERTVGSLADRRNFVIYEPGSFTQVLRRFDAGPGVAAPAGSATRSWDISEAGERAELLALAGQPRQPPIDGPGLLRTAAADLGTYADRYPEWTDARSWADRVASRSRGARASDPVSEALANALAVPGEHLVRLAHVEEAREPLSGLYGLLPAPRDAYLRDPRADFYGRHRIGYATTTRITGAHAIALPGRAPVLLLTLAPIEGRFVDGDSGYGRDPAVLERFDLATPSTLTADHRTISGPSRLGLVVQAAKALDADVAEVIGNTIDGAGMDPFERHDLVTRLVAQAEARTEPIEDFWITGEFKMGDYDFKTQSFAPYQLGLRQIDGPDAEDLPSGAIQLAIDRGAFAIRMPPEEARAFAQTYPKYRELPIRARLGVTGSALAPGAVRLSVDILEYEILQEGSTVTVLDPARVIYRWSSPASAAVPAPETQVAAAAAAQPAPAAPPPPPEPAALDILGVALGAPLDQAVATVVAEVSPTGEFTTTRDLRQAQPGDSNKIKLWDTYATARLFHSDASRISVALFSEPPEGAEVVTAILRAQSFAEGARPHPEAVRTLLLDRYGPPEPESDERTLVWFGAQNPDGGLPESQDPVAKQCFYYQRSFIVSAARGLESARKRFEASNKLDLAVPWVDAAGQPWISPEAVLLDLREAFTFSRDAALLGGCTMFGGVLFATIQTDEDGLVRSLQVALSDPAAAASIGRANEQRLIEAPAHSAAPLEIKL